VIEKMPNPVVADLDAALVELGLKLAAGDVGLLGYAGACSSCWLEWRPAWMATPYSLDLRERVVAAVVRSRIES
jgi:hypothetical protein